MTGLSRDDAIALLMELWLQDMTGSQIARELTRRGAKHSRSAVIGKAHRLIKKGLLPHRRTVVPVKVAPTPSIPKKFIPDRKIKIENIKARQKKHEYKEPTPDNGLGIKFLDIAFGECRWLLDFERGGQRVFCGQPVHLRSFCKHHFDICYIPSSKRHERMQEFRKKANEIERQRYRV